jgi:hypothetical protein
VILPRLSPLNANSLKEKPEILLNAAQYKPIRHITLRCRTCSGSQGGVSIDTKDTKDTKSKFGTRGTIDGTATADLLDLNGNRRCVTGQLNKAPAPQL